MVKKTVKKTAAKKPVKKAAPKAKAAAKKPVKKAVKKVVSKVKKTAKKAAPKAKAKTKRKPNPAFMAPLTPSAALAEIVGAKALPRTEAIKKIWNHIKKNGLQDKKNKREINADAKLKAVLKKDKVTMFDLAKLISKNLSK